MRRLYTLFSICLLLLGAATIPLNVLFAQEPIPGVGLIKGPDDSEAKNLNGGGASFPRPLYELWFATDGSVYHQLTGVNISYQPDGSGFGISNIQNQTLDFGATDGFMTDKQLSEAKGGAILHLPMALGGVALSYNIPELAEPLHLTAENLVQMYFGDYQEVKPDKAWYTDFSPLVMWNDSRLVANNPGLANVNQPITVVRRADSSGTTNIFSSFLEASSTEWAEQVGHGANSLRWPTGVAGAKNAGVAAAINQNPYSIGYVEVSYALLQNLPIAAVQNKTGEFVLPTQTNVSAAAAGVTLPDDLRGKIVDSEVGYPLSGYTWLLVYQNQPDTAKGRALARLAWWAVTDGQVYIQEAGSLTDISDPKFVASGYAPLPIGVIEQTERLIGKLTCSDAPCLPAEIVATIPQ